jgi:hypothetical protein
VSPAISGLQETSEVRYWESHSLKKARTDMRNDLEEIEEEVEEEEESEGDEFGHTFSSS